MISHYFTRSDVQAYYYLSLCTARLYLLNFDLPDVSTSFCSTGDISHQHTVSVAKFNIW